MTLKMSVEKNKYFHGTGAILYLLSIQVEAQEI